MLCYTCESSVHGIIRDEMNRMSPLCEIFCPALGMDAATVGDEEEDHSVTPKITGM